MPQTTHTVQTSGDRIDHYLAAQNLCTSRSESAKLIKDGRVLVNNKAIKASYKVEVGDEIEVNKPELKLTDLKPVKMDFEILYEDQDIIVINKPAGIPVHPGAGNYDRSLVHGLLYHCKDLSGIGGVERPGIVHRLDKGTSGVLIVAKNDKAHQNLSEQFQNKTIKKEYRALCLGEIQKDEQTLVHLMKRAEINRKKFVVNQKKGKEAITHVKVLKKNKKVSYVEVRIETGRTHQIRVHMNFIGHSIVGDEMYGGTKKLNSFNQEDQKYIRDLGRPLLHARQIIFNHPKNGETMPFEAKMPADFEAALDKFFS